MQRCPDLLIVIKDRLSCENVSFREFYINRLNPWKMAKIFHRRLQIQGWEPFCNPNTRFFIGNSLWRAMRRNGPVCLIYLMFFVIFLSFWFYKRERDWCCKMTQTSVSLCSSFDDCSWTRPEYLCNRVPSKNPFLFFSSHHRTVNNKCEVSNQSVINLYLWNIINTNFPEIENVCVRCGRF